MGAGSTLCGGWGALASAAPVLCTLFHAGWVRGWLGQPCSARTCACAQACARACISMSHACAALGRHALCMAPAPLAGWAAVELSWACACWPLPLCVRPPGRAGQQRWEGRKGVLLLPFLARALLWRT